MNTITERLAEALRSLLHSPIPCDCGIQGCGRKDCQETERERLERRARAALAAYDAQRTAPAAGDHAPTQWRYNLHTITADGEQIGVLPRVANARRIVACVNYCAGLPTEYLEGAA